MSLGQPTAPNRLQTITDQWKRERPDIDLSTFMIIAGIYHIAHEVETEFRSFAQKKFGLGTGDLRILLALRRAGPSNPQRPTDLFQSLLITSGAVTKQVERLRHRGLVVRVADPNHKRGCLIQLTEAGRLMADRAIETITTSFAISSAISTLSLEERERGIAFLHWLSSK